MIRPASPQDLPRLEPLAREFYSASKFLKRLDWSRFEAFWGPAIEGDNAVIYLLEDDGRIKGMLGGILFPELYSGDLIATEFFFFVGKDSRGEGLKLYRAFERWAREHWATEIRLVHLMDSMPEKLGRVYRRLGFEPAEMHYSKELEN